MLNEALAKEVERNVTRREEIGNTEELAVPQELKDISIPPDSDPRKRRAMKAATAAARRWKAAVQLQRRRHIKIRGQTSQEWTSRVKRQRSSKAQNIRRRIMTKWMTKEKKEMILGGRQYRIPGDELRQKTSLEKNNSDERTVARTTQESLDGIREKAMRIANLDELGASSSAGRWSSSGEPRMTGTRKSIRLSGPLWVQ